jgi:hypothetical protein
LNLGCGFGQQESQSRDDQHGLAEHVEGNGNAVTSECQELRTLMTAVTA